MAIIREAREGDYGFVSQLMVDALAPFYSGDHEAHAKRIFATHISGGKDNVGHFSLAQKMFILEEEGELRGVVHVVAKRQGTFKISPLIVAPDARGDRGYGSQLLQHAEEFVKAHGARQMYCTVAAPNHGALQFFLRQGYVIAGHSESHYKEGVTELMLYKLFLSETQVAMLDTPSISVLPMEDHQRDAVRRLILERLPKHFMSVDDSWITALFDGYDRRNSKDVNTKYKLMFAATDRKGQVLGVVAATPKKSEPIKLMPLVAASTSAYCALLADLPKLLEPYGRMLYTHAVPTVNETIALQRFGWKFEAAMPAAYHDDHTTQQWSLLLGDTLMRKMRVKQWLLEEIRSGKKDLEVRVGYDNIKTIQAGEKIRFMSASEEHVVTVKDVRIYKTFEDMLTLESHDRVVPGKSHEEARQLLHRLYPANKERLGVYVLELS